MKAIREKLGISQKQLADYLSVPRSQVSMAELGNREMPVKALNKLSNLALLLHETGNSNLQPKKIILTKKQISASRTIFEQNSVRCREKAQQLTLQLEEVRSECQKSVELLQLIEKLVEKLPAGAAGKKDKLWLLMLEDAALKKYHANSPANQDFLQLKINTLQFEAGEGEELGALYK